MKIIESTNPNERRTNTIHALRLQELVKERIHNLEKRDKEGLGIQNTQWEILKGLQSLVEKSESPKGV